MLWTRVYECSNCDGRGSVVPSSQSEKSFSITATVDGDGEQLVLNLYEKLFKKSATSKKELVISKWEVSYNDDNELNFLQKVEKK